VIEGVGVATGDADAARRRAESDAGAGPVTVTFDAEGDVGHAGAASALASVVKACLALDRQIRPAPRGPQCWRHDTADGPRRAGVSARSVDGNHVHVILAECESTAPDQARPFAAPSEALFTFDGDTPGDL